MIDRTSTGRPRQGASPFSFLWAAQFLSQFGDSIFQVAFIWLLLDLTGSKSMTGVAATISYLPSLLFGVLAGFLIDRWNRRGVMAGADLARALLLALATVLLAQGRLTAPLLTAVAFGMATAAVLFNPARDSMLPELVPAEALPRANAWVQLSQQAAFLAGPLAAGVVMAAGGVRAAFPTALLLFAGSLALLLLLRGVGRAHHAAGPPPGLRRDFLDGLRAIAADRTLLLLLLVVALDNLFIMGPWIIGVAVLIRDTLHMDATAYAVSESAYGLGTVIGTLFVGRLLRGRAQGRVLLWAIVLDGFTFMPLYFCRSFAYLYIVLALHSIVIPFLTVPRAVIVQRLVPPARLGRAFALVNVTVFGMTAISTGLTGWALDRLTATQLFAVIGALAGITGLLGMLSSRLRAL